MTPTLFVVDDEPEIGPLVKLFAENEGFSARAFSTVDYLKKEWSAGPPDVLVLDIVMPDQDGIDLINWLVYRNWQSSLVLMSGRDRLYLDMARKLAVAAGLSVAAAIPKINLRETLPSVLKQLAEVSAGAVT